MTDSDALFTEFSRKMRQEKLSELTIENFRFYYEQLVQGVTGFISEDSIESVENLPSADTFDAEATRVGRDSLPKTVMLKLNGGLGTSMGLARAKSLLKVKHGLSFLDIMAKQSLTLGTPLVLMNSFATRRDSLSALKGYSGLSQGLPLDFLQNKVPKVRQDDLRPVSCPENPSLEWCPPGHGDLYAAISESGTLEKLLDNGYRYAFVSNSDNLGAVIDEKILGYFVSKRLPFLMEVADRTVADQKGGHLARLADGSNRLVLREASQCSEEDRESFENIRRYSYFNTNNLWVSLDALYVQMKEHKWIARLPMICNSKTLDPANLSSTPVFQLETAMGAAISQFQEAGAVRVPRTRFSPVKTSRDLLAVRSDLTILTSDFLVQPNPVRTMGPFAGTLDPHYYSNIRKLETRFPSGPPSLIACNTLEVCGDFTFGKNVVFKGDVRLLNDSGSKPISLTTQKLTVCGWHEF